MMNPLHPSFTPYPSHLQSASRLSPTPPPPPLSHPTLPQCLPLAAASNVSNPSIDLVLLYPVYVCYIVILFVSLTDEATIKAKRFICFLKESRVTLSFVVKSKLVTILLLFIFTLLHSYSFPLQLH